MTEPKLLGVCAWISDKFDLDVSGVRLVWIILTLLGIGTPVLIYFILALIKPKDW